MTAPVPPGGLTIVIGSFLEEDQVARIAAHPAAGRVVYEPDLLPVPRYPCDHTAPPRPLSEADRDRWRALAQGAHAYFDFDWLDPAGMPARSPGLRWIQATSAGLGAFMQRTGLDPDAASGRITVTTAAGVHAVPLAEFALMGALHFVKGVPLLARRQREQHWQRYTTRQLAGRRALVAAWAASAARSPPPLPPSAWKSPAWAATKASTRSPPWPASSRKTAWTRSSPAPTSSCWPARDAAAAAGLPFPFDQEGTPKRRVELIAAGRVGGVVSDLASAAATGGASTGHAHIARESSPAPEAANLVMAPGPATEAELIAGVERGLYVQRLWYNRLVDAEAGIITGTSRDGCFLIEDGKLTTALATGRFTESVLGALARADGIGQRLVTLPVPNVWNGAASAPAIRVRGFRFGRRPAGAS